MKSSGTSHGEENDFLSRRNNETDRNRVEIQDLVSILYHVHISLVYQLFIVHINRECCNYGLSI